MKIHLFILLNTFLFILSSTGDISAFDKDLQKIINTYSADYKKKFTKIFKDGPIYSGDGTAYGMITHGGNCLFPKEEYYAEFMFAALNHDQYFDDMGCGTCALVVSTSNPNKPVRVRIIDQCPECEHGSLDFTDKAFKLLTGMDPARVKITWALIPCDIDIPDYPALVEKDSDIKFQFKTGSSQFWFQVLVFNTKYPVALVEVDMNGKFVEMKREAHNYWSKPEGNVGDSFNFRVTLADSSVILAKNVKMVVPADDEDSDYSTGDQTIEK